MERAATLLKAEGVQKTKLCGVCLSLSFPRRKARSRIHRRTSSNAEDFLNVISKAVLRFGVHLFNANRDAFPGDKGVGA